jgi:hypothetical protein
MPPAGKKTPARRRRYKALPTPVTGTAPGSPENQDHAGGFSLAIQAALEKADDAGWPRGQDFTAEVQLRAVVSRYNPGAIDQYRATIVPTGPAGG